MLAGPAARSAAGRIDPLTDDHTTTTDDRTVTKPQAQVVRAAGRRDPTPPVIRPAGATRHRRRARRTGAGAAARRTMGNNLPVGTFLGEFEITELLGEGGFGIVYLARDHSLQRRVALKEYMPSSLAARTAADAGVGASPSATARPSRPA